MAKTVPLLCVSTASWLRQCLCFALPQATPHAVQAENTPGGAGYGQKLMAAVCGFFDQFAKSRMFGGSQPFFSRSGRQKRLGPGSDVSFPAVFAAWLFVYSLLNGVGGQIATTFTEYYCASVHLAPFTLTRSGRRSLRIVRSIGCISLHPPPNCPPPPPRLSTDGVARMTCVVALFTHLPFFTHVRKTTTSSSRMGIT